ncbi:uncharacterized protein VDAG_00661 [Verticillium dahliae VdLs.17]|uniref:CENP-V/GFA domain-containing protein n=1 Tax=Verticillium dahliae (strain VdLs.17 / ATCC MYA-4575 / FGSC 10137) TaxID=498257 RepID=G2WQL9_VERDV|nr:uncharacterized protein VDAG_00661 [Verticillium dahliae VdLs.17]EGY13979.1 hypothetical protein VDAG_00661 [Verticillium dahliae VdLs.17]
MPPPNLALRQIPSSLLDQLSLPHPAGTGPSDSTPILPRQNSDPEIIVPATYGGTNSGLEPAAVAGITLGAVAGFLLLVYVLYMCANGVGPSADYRSSTYGASTLSVRRRSRSRAHRHQSRGPSRARVVATERVRVRESGVGAPFVVEAEPVPMRERTRSVSRAPPPPRVVDDEDDEVVVIEEHTPPRRSRRHSRRGSGALPLPVLTTVQTRTSASSNALPPLSSQAQVNDMADLTTYRGNCHCGAFVFEVDLPVLTSVTECNCSICRRKGYIGDFPISRDVFRIVKGNEDDLAVYEFGAKKYQHKFCATCGTAVIMSNAYIWVWPMREQVVLFSDEKNISRYEFGKKNMGKMFCRICSVHMTNFAAEKSEEELAAMSGEERAYFEGGKARHPVNLRVIDGLDLDALRGKITRIKGAEAPPAYVNP